MSNGSLMLAVFALALALPPTLFEAPTVRGAHVAIYAVDAQSGAEVYARDPDALMVPASNFKLIVGSASLDVLGPAFAFTTTLSTDGSALYLRGDGDPLLNAADFTDAARTLAAAHQTQFASLDGDVSAITNATRYPPGWGDDDLPYDYAAPPSALGFDDNVVQVYVMPGRAAGDPAGVSVTPAQNAVSVDDGAVTGAAGSDDTIEPVMVWETPNALRIIGSIPMDSKPDNFGISVLDAPKFALSMLANALSAGGITIAGGTGFATAPGNARVLWTHRSQALPGLLQSMWLPSDNLLAESLLDALGGGSRDAGIARERTWLASIGIDAKGLTLADGSGLSAYDRISPRDLVTILAHDWNGPYHATVLAALPVAGESGTLEHAFLGTPLVGKVIAKTGTVNHTRTLSGYLQTAHGTIIFSLLVNDWLDPTPQAGEKLRAFQASVLEALANG
jgi:serine-type D-Ala-D-Ala carboxypeptidase/endopeptidase (penicillin-binding protein 4)